ncbi:group I intron-associated PD-(D/E)XK endonuclease [Haloparvum sp. PAK95]|uniref:group I intron-associated PD-(D/E)XK endonuclease n=1 Tax=Haloparvum sp. PAK95 TaxID=3418962 RepID=UPI003D2F1AF2
MTTPDTVSANRAGQIAEHIVSITLIRQGYNVAVPEIPCHYDQIVDIDGELTRVQVKKGFDDSRENTIRANLMGSIHKGGTEYESVKYSKEDIDAFAIYDPAIDDVYWFWFDEAPSTELRRKRNTLKSHILTNKL